MNTSGLPTSPRDVRLSPPRQPSTRLPRERPGPGARRTSADERRSSSRERERRRRPSTDSSQSGSGKSSPTAAAGSSQLHSVSGWKSEEKRSRSPSLSGEDISNPRKLHRQGSRTPPSAFNPVNLPVVPFPPPKAAPPAQQPPLMPFPAQPAPAPRIPQAPPMLHSNPSANSVRTVSSTRSRRPRLALWPSSAYCPSPYTFRAAFEGLVCLWSFILVILGGTVVAGTEDEEKRPAVTLLLFASAMVLLWFPTTLTIARVRPTWLRSPLDRVWLHALVTFLLWTFFLGGSAAISSPLLSTPARITCGFGFVCWILLTFDLALTALRVIGLRRGGGRDAASGRASPARSNPGDVEKQQPARPPSPVVDPSLPLLKFLLVVPINASNLFPSYASRYPEGPVRTWVPPSSSAWPSALPPAAQAEAEKQQFRNSPNAAFLGSSDASHLPDMRETGYRASRTSIPRMYAPTRQSNPSDQWIARNAEQGYLETLASEELRRMGETGHLQGQRNAHLVSQYSAYTTQSQESVHRPPPRPLAPEPHSRRGSDVSVESRMSSYFREGLKGLPGTPPLSTPSSLGSTSPSTSTTQLNTTATAASVRGAEVRQAQRQPIANSRRL